MHSRWWWFGGGAVVLATVGVVGVHRTQGDTASTVQASKPHDFAWRIGERRTYALVLSSVVRMDAQTILDVRVEGKLRATRLGGERLTAAMVFEPSSVTLTGSEKEETESVRKALAEPFGISFGFGGFIDAIGFAEVKTPEPSRAIARGLLRTVASGLQVAAKPAPDVREWRVAERDAVGRVETKYSEQSATSLLKQKLAYLKVEGGGKGLEATTEIERSMIDLAFSDSSMAAGSLSSVRQSETTRVSSEGPLPPMSSELSLQLTLDETDVAKQQELQALAGAFRGYRHLPLDDRSAEKRIAIDHAKLQGPSFQELLGAVATLDPADPRERARVFSLLKSRLRFSDEAVGEAEELISAGAPQKDMLIDALGSAGSASAQGVLHEVIRGKAFTDGDRRRALIALGFTKQPSEETLALLDNLRSDPEFGTQALYGLGSAANYLAASDPARATEVVKDLVTSLDNAETPTEQVKMLKAVGNAGSGSALDSILAKLDSGEAGVRAAAVWALRRIPGQEADQRIALAIQRDPSPDVRQSALETLSYRSPSPVLVYALRDRLQGEEVAAVRRNVVRAAMRWAHEAPALDSVLARLAKSDTDEKVRKLLAGWKS